MKLLRNLENHFNESASKMSLESLVEEFLSKGGEVKEIPPSEVEVLKVKSNWSRVGRGQSARRIGNHHCLQVDPLVDKIFTCR